MLFKRDTTPQMTIMHGKIYGKIQQISIHPLLEETMTKYGFMDRGKKTSDEKKSRRKINLWQDMKEKDACMIDITKIIGETGKAAFLPVTHQGEWKLGKNCFGVTLPRL